MKKSKFYFILATLGFASILCGTLFLFTQPMDEGLGWVLFGLSILWPVFVGVPIIFLTLGLFNWRRESKDNKVIDISQTQQVTEQRNTIPRKTLLFISLIFLAMFLLMRILPIHFYGTVIFFLDIFSLPTAIIFFFIFLFDRKARK